MRPFGWLVGVCALATASAATAGDGPARDLGAAFGVARTAATAAPDDPPDGVILVARAGAEGAPVLDAAGLPDRAARRYRALSREPTGYSRIFGSLAFGEGLRFNNPYRLQTQLGEDAESLSLTAPYVDVAVGLVTGPPDGLQHGGALHLSAALAGVPQQVITPSYTALYRGAHRILGYGRAGLPVILSPDVNVGVEVAAGVGLFVTAACAFTAELTGDLFYGAGTREVSYAMYPILSGQLGVLIDYEVLP